MAKPPITQARDVDAELVLQLNKFGSAADLRSQQAKLTGAAREIRKLTGGGTDLFGKLGCYLSFEQKQLLQDAARLLDSVNQQVEHAKEKRDRDEKQAKKRRELRERLAKQLVASNYPLPGNTLEERLEILQIALIYNRAKVFDPLYSTHQLHSKLKRWLERPKPETQFDAYVQGYMAKAGAAAGASDNLLVEAEGAAMLQGLVAPVRAQQRACGQPLQNALLQIAHDLLLQTKSQLAIAANASSIHVIQRDMNRAIWNIATAIDHLAEFAQPSQDTVKVIERLMLFVGSSPSPEGQQLAAEASAVLGMSEGGLA